VAAGTQGNSMSLSLYLGGHSLSASRQHLFLGGFGAILEGNFRRSRVFSFVLVYISQG